VINILKPRVTKKEYKTRSDIFCQKEEKQIMIKLKNFYKNTNLILHIFIKASVMFFLLNFKKSKNKYKNTYILIKIKL